ncbi:MAG: ADP-forming succinate--CoA ligase subunit beta [Planctomycetota bacterium]
MNIHEYQAKKLLKEYNIKILEGICIKNTEEVDRVIERIGVPVVGKVQVHAGGRGKSGGIKILKSKEEIVQFVNHFLGKPFKSYQTGARSIPVSAILFEKPANIKRELYLAVTYDKKSGKIVILTSKFGGVEIEEIARSNPDNILKKYLINDRIAHYQMFEMLKFLELNPATYEHKFRELVSNCVKLYVEKDATLLEINPLIETQDDELVALDAKINFDYRGVEKHPEILEFFDPSQENPNELKASKIGINYIELEGNIGCLVNGAGLAMATMDLIKFYGGNPANFLDVGGGATRQQLLDAFKILLSNMEIKAILVNIFGGILRTDILAESLVESVKEIKPRIPIVVRLEGTNSEQAAQIIKESNLQLYAIPSLSEAAKKVIEFAKAN